MKQVECKMKQVECKIQLSLSQIIWGIFVSILFLSWTLLCLYFFIESYNDPESETLWGGLVPIFVGFYLEFLMVKRLHSYIFTETEIRKRYLLLPFLGSFLVKRYADLDCYYSIFTNRHRQIVRQDGSGYVHFEKETDLWFVKGKKVLFSLDTRFSIFHYSNLKEAIDLIPIPFAGFGVLSEYDYNKNNISQATIVYNFGETVNSELYDKDVNLVVINGLHPGCLYKVALCLIIPLFLISLFIFTEYGVSRALFFFFFFAISPSLAIFIFNRKKGWLTIDEKNNMLSYESCIKPFIQKKTLPFQQVQFIKVDCNSNKSTIYDRTGAVWIELPHEKVLNLSEMTQAINVLHARGKINMMVAGNYRT